MEPQRSYPAAIIFHFSCRQAGDRPSAAAYSRCSYRRRRRDSLFLGCARSRLGPMAAWLGSDSRRRGPVDRISHAICRAIAGSMLSRNCFFLVPPAFLDPARRNVHRSQVDYCVCVDCLARPGSVFSRWAFVRAPRDCDSSFKSPATVVTSADPTAVSFVV